MNGGVCFVSPARGAFALVNLSRQMGGTLAIARHRLPMAEPILLGHPILLLGQPIRAERLIRIALHLQRVQFIQAAAHIRTGHQCLNRR